MPESKFQEMSDMLEEIMQLQTRQAQLIGALVSAQELTEQYSKNHKEIKEDNERTRVMHNLTYHAPNKDQQGLYHDIREEAVQMAEVILDCCPVSRERALALTNLDALVMWSNASIARSVPMGGS